MKVLERYVADQYGNRYDYDEFDIIFAQHEDPQEIHEHHLDRSQLYRELEEIDREAEDDWAAWRESQECCGGRQWNCVHWGWSDNPPERPSWIYRIDDPDDFPSWVELPWDEMSVPDVR
mgnify:CR=1 FL=1